MIRKRNFYILYLVLDFLTSFSLWSFFWYIRKTRFEGIASPEWDWKFFLLGLGISFFWLALLWLWGLYEHAFDKSFLQQAWAIIQVSFLGSTIIFFAAFLNDPIKNYKDFHYMYLIYLSLQGFFLIFVRLLVKIFIARQIKSGRWQIPTLIIGQGKKASDIYEKIKSLKYPVGKKIVGYVKIDANRENLLKGKLKKIADIEEIKSAIFRRKIQEVIIALEDNEHKIFLSLIQTLRDTPVDIKVVPDLYDYFIGNVRVTSILQELPLVSVYPKLLSTRESFIKRTIDIVVSLIVLILMLPLFIIIAIAIKLNSPGPVFFKQERIGKDGKPFMMYKFRSMVKDAEKYGPALAQDEDPRVTKVGKFLRKTRLDEIPQFFNVLKGDMSLVGPRPERQYYIQQIVEKAPEYMHLLKVRPGITGVGQVKHGYAANLDELINKMKWDLIYIEKFSLLLDLKILIETFRVVIEGRGR